MMDAFSAHEMDAHVLAASLRTPEDVAHAFSLGCMVTAKPELLEKCLTPQQTLDMVKEFNNARIL